MCLNIKTIWKGSFYVDYKLIKQVRKYNSTFASEIQHLDLIFDEEIYANLRRKKTGVIIACISKGGISIAQDGIFFDLQELALLLRIGTLIRELSI